VICGQLRLKIVDREISWSAGSGIENAEIPATGSTGNWSFHIDFLANPRWGFPRISSRDCVLQEAMRGEFGAVTGATISPTVTATSTTPPSSPPSVTTSDPHPLAEEFIPSLLGRPTPSTGCPASLKSRFFTHD
jgi:hypothetical protein